MGYLISLESTLNELQFGTKSKQIHSKVMASQGVNRKYSFNRHSLKIPIRSNGFVSTLNELQFGTKSK